MDREALVRQLEHAQDVRAQKVTALRDAQPKASPAPDARGRLSRLRHDVARADERIASLKNALSALERIGVDTTRHYVAKRHAP